MFQKLLRELRGNDRELETTRRLSRPGPLPLPRWGLLTNTRPPATLRRSLERPKGRTRRSCAQSVRCPADTHLAYGPCQLFAEVTRTEVSSSLACSHPHLQGCSQMLLRARGREEYASLNPRFQRHRVTFPAESPPRCHRPPPPAQNPRFTSRCGASMLGWSAPGCLLNFLALKASCKYLVLADFHKLSGDLLT